MEEENNSTRPEGPKGANPLKLPRRGGNDKKLAPWEKRKEVP